MENILQGLNEAQRCAVANEAAVLQVLAPPGSGKTKTLTARVGHLISNNGLQPRNIIVCTFTIKAANEMKERIAGYLGEDVASKLVLGTFHSISRRLLATHGKKIGLNEKFGIADSSDTMSVLTRVIKRLSVNIPPAQARTRISSLKSQGIDAEHFALSSKKADQQEIVSVYAEYEDHLKVSNLLDFDDLLVRCVELLRRYPLCVANIEAVLIDEFQDTNNIQYDLMQLFAQCKRAITIVGDPDQSIYGWRNAEIRNLRKMQDHYPDTCVVKLEENYRTSGAILLSAQEVIEQDQSRPAKRLMPTHSVGMRPVLRKLPSAAAEAHWIVSEIKRTSCLTGELLKYSDYSILLRSASLSRHIESALGKEGIPYRMVGGHKFFDRLEVKLVLDYLRVLNHPEHNEALARIINVPSRKIGDVTIQRLLEECDNRKIPLWTLVLGIAQGNIKPNNAIHSQGQRGLELFTNLMLTTSKKLSESSRESFGLDDFVAHVITKIGLEGHLKKLKPEEFESRWANVQELVVQAADFSTSMMEGTIQGQMVDAGDLPDTESTQPLTTEEALSVFLANVALSTEVQKGDDEHVRHEQVTISTIHAAKGLEWPVVFIAAAYDGSLPHSRAEDTDEERRLLYVAMTRAQCLLYLSNPQKNSMGECTVLSPFLSQRPMPTYFDNCGPAFDHTVVVELAGILRRTVPDRKLVSQAMMTLERVLDDRWPRGGDDDEESERKKVYWDGPVVDGGAASNKNRFTSTSTNANMRFSTTTNTLSTTFMSAATALSTLKPADLNANDKRGIGRSEGLFSVTKKRKTDEQGTSGKGQQNLKGFFVHAGSKTKIAKHCASKADQEPESSTVEASDEHLPRAGQASRWIPQGRSSEPVARHGAPIPPRPTFERQMVAPSLHTTSMQLVNAAPHRRTLGVRRSLNGWAGRNVAQAGQAKRPGA